MGIINAGTKSCHLHLVWRESKASENRSEAIWAAEAVYLDACVDASEKAFASLGNQLPEPALMSCLHPPAWVGGIDSS